MALIGDVLRVLRASGQVPRQNGGPSSYATVSGRKLWRFRSCRGSRNALFDSGFVLCVSTTATFGSISGFLRVWVDSAPEDDFRPALWTSPCLRSWSRLWKFLSSWPRTSSTTAVACFLLVLLVITHLALCSRRLAEWRSVRNRCFAEQFFLKNLDNFSMSPLVFLQSFSQSAHCAC